MEDIEEAPIVAWFLFIFLGGLYLQREPFPHHVGEYDIYFLQNQKTFDALASSIR